MKNESNGNVAHKNLEYSVYKVCSIFNLSLLLISLFEKLETKQESC